MRQMLDKVTTATTPADAQASELSRTQLKVLIDQKRRNDAVRKREFDLLRSVRREGLSSEHFAWLDEHTRPTDNAEAWPEQVVKAGVLAKIDAIERQMASRHGLAGLLAKAGRPGLSQAQAPAAAFANTVPMKLRGERRAAAFRQAFRPAPPPSAAGEANSVPATDWGARSSALQAHERPMDAELSLPVMAFANAEFGACEQALLHLLEPGGPREGQADTWAILLDFYRATGQQQRFEQRAEAFAHRFGESPPDWRSLPGLIAEQQVRPELRPDGQAVGWICPPSLDPNAVAHLASHAVQLPPPWLIDWSPLLTVDAEGAAALLRLLNQWAEQAVPMHWLATQHLLRVLNDIAPVGVADVDPVFWLAQLRVLHLLKRADLLDTLGIDYCVTYELSPPAWPEPQCSIRELNDGHHTEAATLSILGDAQSTLAATSMEAGAPMLVTLALSGQLVGDQQRMLDDMSIRVERAEMVELRCDMLVRVDFVAGSDLLNWVVAQRQAGRDLAFTQVHRLIDLLFQAIGMHEHTDIRVRLD
ncbi:MAG: hypothetical protein CFE46_05430 [Burkholderiales bacterium PBB6]|nr:MAG: hypothetical protein CFE46_05430 [Burkholderiales bacterium PBB6]